MCLLLSAAGASTRAQWTPYSTPEFEASGSFSYVRAHGTNSGAFNLNGGSGGLTYNVRHWFAVVANVGAYRFEGLPSGISSNMYTYAAGPRINFRNNRHCTRFAQALVGAGRLTAASGGLHASENSVVLLAGAGIDLPISHGFAIRAGEIDYLLTRFALSNGSSATENNLRVSFGVVFRFGDK
jgi:Outer membrane protein beta-barrel domain